LGEALAAYWTEAVPTIQGEVDGQPYLVYLADHLATVGDAARAGVVRDLAGRPLGDPRSLGPDRQGPIVSHPEEVLAELIACLWPDGQPSYAVDRDGDIASWDLTRPGLLRLAQSAQAARGNPNADQRPAIAVERLFDHRVLIPYANLAGFEWLERLDRDWHRTYIGLGQLLDQAAEGAAAARRSVQGRLRQAGVAQDQFLLYERDAWELEGDDSEFARASQAWILAALLVPGAAAVLRAKAESAVDASAVTQDWFARLAEVAPSRSGDGPLTRTPAVASTVRGRVPTLRRHWWDALRHRRT
jgi:hypothetical protein